MPRTKDKFSPIELRDTLSLASLIGVLPQSEVADSLKAADCLDGRRRILPKVFVVYLIVFLCLFKEKATDEVLKHLFEGLDSLFEDRRILRASDAAISKARERIGEEPLRHLFTSVCKPLCRQGDEYAYYHGLRKCAIDASEFYLPCTKDVLRDFPTAEDDGKNPQNCSKLKFGAVMETGSHAYIDADYGTVDNSEQDFADTLIGRIGAGNLLVGDRYYRSVLNIVRVKEQGSEVLFRATSNMRLEPVKRLYDGSYIAEIKASKNKERHASAFADSGKKYKSVKVRVMPFVIKNDSGDVVDSGRLLSTLLDPAKYHAQELIDIYTERWEEEMGFDEIKTHLMGGAQDSLRSKTAELVRQEFWAMLIAHYLIRKIIYEASGLARLMPARISFVGVRDVVQRKTTAKLFSPS